MSMNRREFLQTLAVASAGGLALDVGAAPLADGMASFYKLDPLPAPGRVTLMHMTDCHAQLTPIRFREPDVNLGIAGQAGKPPHLVGEALLKKFGIAPGTRDAHAFTYLDFEKAARLYGKLGGFAHLATMVKRLKA